MYTSEMGLSNPPVPYSGPIQGGLFPGKAILVAGTVLPDPVTFEISLKHRYKCENTMPKRYRSLYSLPIRYTKSDITFHFNPRFDKRDVVCNTLTWDQWGAEEKHQSNFPFTAGQPFEIIIHVENDCYKVAVNRRHFLEYRHRLPWKNAKFLSISGCVVVKTLRFYKNQNIQRNQLSCPFSVVPNSVALQSRYKPALPFSHVFHNGLSVGKMIYISGRPFSQSHLFRVDFFCDSVEDNAFHFSPRFGRGVVVRNSWIDRSWDIEETDASHFPFKPDVSFDMMIEVLNDRFAVAVNGQHFVNFCHRVTPVSRISSLHIDGHVDITTVRFHQ